MRAPKVFLIISLFIFLLEAVYFFFGTQSYLGMFGAYSNNIKVSFWAMPVMPLLCAGGVYFFIRYVNNKQKTGEKIKMLSVIATSFFIFSLFLFYFLTFWGAYVAFQISI